VAVNKKKNEMYFHSYRCRRGRASVDDFGHDTAMECFSEPTDLVTDTVLQLEAYYLI